MSLSLSTFQEAAVGAAHGGVRRVLQLEALAILSGAVAGYFLTGGALWLFLLGFMLPDLSMIAYAFGSRAGAAAYNALHSYVAPVVLGGAGLATGEDVLWQLALLHTAHISFDRSLGYGLKYSSAFSDTHLGGIGKNKKS